MKKSDVGSLDEQISEKEAALNGGYSDTEFHGQIIWNGEKLVTPKTWESEVGESDQSGK